MAVATQVVAVGLAVFNLHLLVLLLELPTALLLVREVLAGLVAVEIRVLLVVIQCLLVLQQRAVEMAGIGNLLLRWLVAMEAQAVEVVVLVGLLLVGLER